MYQVSASEGSGEYLKTRSTVVRTFTPFTTEFQSFRSDVPVVKRDDTKSQGALAQ
jgi:hypothetical protein